MERKLQAVNKSTIFSLFQRLIEIQEEHLACRVLAFSPYTFPKSLRDFMLIRRICLQSGV